MAQMFPALQATDSISINLASDVNINTATSGAYTYCAIYVGGAGDVKVVMAEDDTSTITTFSSVPAGTFLPIAAKLIKSTTNGTTATNLVGLVSKTGIR